MNKLVKIYRCNICGNIVYKLHDGQGELVCCGKPMELLTANTTDAAIEKHVPYVIDQNKTCDYTGNKVVKIQIGETVHPMSDEHHIE